jgi:hypothetical protein
MVIIMRGVLQLSPILSTCHSLKHALNLFCLQHDAIQGSSSPRRVLAEIGYRRRRNGSLLVGKAGPMIANPVRRPDHSRIPWSLSKLHYGFSKRA